MRGQSLTLPHVDDTRCEHSDETFAPCYDDVPMDSALRLRGMQTTQNRQKSPLSGGERGVALSERKDPQDTDEYWQRNRNNLRAALWWTLQSNTRTAVVVTLFVSAGIASILDCLRWHHFIVKVSFSLLCLLIVVIIVIARFRKNTIDPQQRDGGV